MQAPTHILAGVLVEELTRRPHRLPFKKFLIVVICVIFHIIFDKFARITYHPPKPLFKDVFWVIYHTFLLIVTIVLLKHYWKDRKLGIIASIFPDIDWIVFRPITTIFPELETLQGPVTHRLLEDILSVVLPLQSFDTLPNWNLIRPTVLIEIAVLYALFVAVQYLSDREHRHQSTIQSVQ